ncbi:MAG TPA: hypothetical protein VNB95_00725 [Nitrososphaera sp.]|nr:hypothetical protein [Nitrososphaera sp.]
MHKNTCPYNSIVPAPLGVNSSLTIWALAFRIALNLEGDKHLPVEIAEINGKKHLLPMYYFFRFRIVVDHRLIR